MPRIAGDNPGYTFRLCRSVEDFVKPTKYGFELPSITTVLGEVLAKPPSAMAWWGFRIGLEGVAQGMADGESFEGLDAETIEELLKARDCNPNVSRDEAGDRGDAAHEVLEHLAASLEDPARRTVAITAAEKELAEAGTEYGAAVIDWWDQEVAPYLGNGIDAVLSEVPIWSLVHRYSGTFDLAILWNPDNDSESVRDGWELLDLKTHKPASGFTKEGRGPAYIHDVAQLRGYRLGFEECARLPEFARWREVTGVKRGAKTIGNRTIVARDKAYRGVRWLEDIREVDEPFVWLLRDAYDFVLAFEKGAA